MKVYIIERHVTISAVRWRFRSLITDAKGAWRYDYDIDSKNNDGERRAIGDGEQHQAIMERLCPQLRADYTPEKIYVIDKGNPSLLGAYSYRFRSLANSTVGKWHENDGAKEKAQREGEQHQAIMERIYPQLRDCEISRIMRIDRSNKSRSQL